MDAPPDAPTQPIRGELVPTVDDALDMVGADRTHLHGRMLLHRKESFEAKPEIAALYEDLFRNLVIEASAIPGFGLAQEMLLERIAYIWAEQKRLDNLEEFVSAAQYEKLLGRYTQLLNALFRSRSEKAAEEAFMRTTIGAFVRATRQALDAELPGEPEKAVAITRRVIEALRAEGDRIVR